MFQGLVWTFFKLAVLLLKKHAKKMLILLNANKNANEVTKRESIKWNMRNSAARCSFLMFFEVLSLVLVVFTS